MFLWRIVKTARASEEHGGFYSFGQLVQWDVAWRLHYRLLLSYLEMKELHRWPEGVRKEQVLFFTCKRQLKYKHRNDQN